MASYARRPTAWESAPMFRRQCWCGDTVGGVRERPSRELPRHRPLRSARLRLVAAWYSLRRWPTLRLYRCERAKSRLYQLRRHAQSLVRRHSHVDEICFYSPRWLRATSLRQPGATGNPDGPSSSKRVSPVAPCHWQRVLLGMDIHAFGAEGGDGPFPALAICGERSTRPSDFHR